MPKNTTKNNESKCTRGPWIAVDDAVFDGDRKDAGQIANCVWGDLEVAKANALLMAAAPEMIDVCRRLTAWNNDVNGDGIQLERICRAAKKAMAKAERRA